VLSRLGRVDEVGVVNEFRRLDSRGLAIVDIMDVFSRRMSRAKQGRERRICLQWNYRVRFSARDLGKICGDDAEERRAWVA
jgi:hypothetical protein